MHYVYTTVMDSSLIVKINEIINKYPKPHGKAEQLNIVGKLMDLANVTDFSNNNKRLIMYYTFKYLEDCEELLDSDKFRNTIKDKIVVFKQEQGKFEIDTFIVENIIADIDARKYLL